LQILQSAALKTLKDNYDIIFVDIGLPDISDFELINLIKQKLLIDKPIPIIALTGYSEEEKQKCLEAGANEVAVKLISKGALGRLLTRHFS
jgi:CheY-like chemotaxis protein